MVVKFTPKFTAQEIMRQMQAKVDRTLLAVITRMQYIGEEFVASARKNGTYNDITGNLRNSVGYIIVQDGKILYDNFQKTATGRKKATNGVDGVRVGYQLAVSVIKEMPANGFALICVAGMNYAAAVESKGRDVITGSAQVAEQELKTAIKNIQAKLKAA
jgi:hypothetical protein